MEEVLTEELLKELLNRPDIDSFMDEKNLDDIKFVNCLNDFMNEKGMEASYVSNANYLSWNTIMGYESGGFTFVFPDCESFFKYSSHMGIKCDRNDISDGSMIMSRRFAANRGMKI